MASTFTANIGIEEPATGDYPNVWGGVVNSNMTDIDNALGSATSIVMSNSNVTLTVAQAAYYRIIITGSITTNLQLILPSGVGGTRYIQNITTGAYTVSVLNGSGDAGGGIVVPQGLITPVILTGGQAYYDNYQSVPPGTILTYAGGTAPPGFLFTIGQTLSTTAYPFLFNAIGYTFGGSGTSFLLPDTRGRVLAAADNMGGSPASRLNGYVIGSAGGTQNTTLSTGQLPSHNHPITDPGHSHTLTDPGHTHSYVEWVSTGTGAGGNGTSPGYTSSTTATTSNTTGITMASATTGITTQNTGSGSSVPLIQPTIAINHIIRF